MSPLHVLDLGCSEGIVGRWLTERADVVIDGIELHAESAERARARGYREVKVGPAQAAPDLFEPHTYQAVVLYELIEHAADMDELLDAAERMLAPGGRVFVSTPDGVFGDGGNPMHLRALRSIDLADLLRHRGRLLDMEVGEDGITVAAYTPERRRGDVAIFCGPSLATWHPSDMLTKGLGGSETAAVRVAEHLSCLGFVVTVYGQVEQGCWKDVIFRDWRTFDPMDRRAAVICSRIPEVGDRFINAPVRLLWVHDIDCADRLTPRRADVFDHILVLSEFQLRRLAGLYPFAKDKLVLTRNGLEMSLFRERESAAA